MASDNESGKPVIGLVETVWISGKEKLKVRARVDTGAVLSSIDSALLEKLGPSEVVGKKSVRSANGKTVRPIVELKLEMEGKEVREKFTVADRQHMKYKLLIGQNILKKGFFIDPSR